MNTNCSDPMSAVDSRAAQSVQMFGVLYGYRTCREFWVAEDSDADGEGDSEI